MKRVVYAIIPLFGFLIAVGVNAERESLSSLPLGLQPVPYPVENPQTPEKIALGERLFLDARFSSTGDVSCSTCHLPEKAFTDSPLSVSEGIHQLTGTRNAPTVINAAFATTLSD